MSNKIYELSDSDFINLIKSSHSVREVLFKLDLTTVGNSWGYSLVKRRMKELQLNGTSFLGKECKRLPKLEVIKTEDVLVEHSTSPRCVVRRKILEDGLLEYKCSKCGISDWAGKPLSLELDHINGVNDDNRIENLRFLCPNCHSQTKTYGSKNAVKTAITRFHLSDEDIDAIVKLYTKYGNMDKVVENSKYRLGAVRQIVKDKGLNNAKNQKFVIRYDLENKEIGRWGSINECCSSLIDNGELKTTSIKTARNTFLRNRDKEVWLNSKWKVIDAY